MLDLEPIKARAAKATDGPWIHWPADSDNDHRVCQANGEKDKCICCLALMGYTDEEGEWTIETLESWQADGDFIAAARTDIPVLVAEVERLRAEIASLRARDVCQNCGASRY